MSPDRLERSILSKIEGQIVELAENGDVITDISVERLAHVPHDDRVKVSCDGHTTNRLLPHDHDEPAGTLVAVLSLNGRLIISLAGSNAGEFLGLRAGMPVVVHW